MIGYCLSLDQLRSAPPEVRRWVEREVAASLAALTGSERHPPEAHAAKLAACTPEEARQVYGLLKGDFLLSQVFFELARDLPASPGPVPFHAIPVQDVLRHTKLADPDRLVGYLGTINQALQLVRNDSEASLFGFDQTGHIYIHETTYRSIRQLWEQLVAAHNPVIGIPDGPNGRAAADFAPPYLGPSEPIAGHALPPEPSS